MQVKILFSGLCFFAPEAQKKRMHVFMPKTPVGHMRHVSILSFDIAHLSPTSTKLSEVRAHISLRDHTLELPGAGADLTLCPQIVNLRPVANSDVQPTLFDDPPQGKILSRVTLLAGNNTRVAPGECWTFNGQLRPIAHQVEWTINSPEPSLKLDFGSIGAAGALPSQVLHPLGGANGTLTLFVHHVPADDLPPDPAPLPSQRPAPNFEPPHFEMFYDLFVNPASKELPKLSAAGTNCPVANPCNTIVFAGGSPFTCMVGGVQP